VDLQSILKLLKRMKSEVGPELYLAARWDAATKRIAWDKTQPTINADDRLGDLILLLEDQLKLVGGK
jgi:hypothetical protein